MKHSNIQITIHETDKDGEIHIHSEKGAAIINMEYAPIVTVARMLNISRSSAYRLMSKLRRYTLYDHRANGVPFTMTVVKRSDVIAYKRKPAGNPHFKDAAYQRELAKRPRKKEVDK